MSASTPAKPVSTTATLTLSGPARNARLAEVRPPLRHRRFLLEAHVLTAKVVGRGVEIVNNEADVVDRTLHGRPRRAVAMR